MEWHTLSGGNVLYFIVEDLSPMGEGGVQATVCSSKTILNVASLADRPTAMTWLEGERRAKLHDHYCTIHCHPSDS